MPEIPMGPVGGIPTAPSQGGQQVSPQPEIPQEKTVPVPPDGAGIVQDALGTITKFALAQREQGNPAIAEALKGLVMAMGSGSPQQPDPGQLPPEAQPQGIAPGVPVQGGNAPINA